MATDFSLQFPCEVRKAIPEVKLFHMVKYQALALFAAARFKEAYPDADRATILNKCTVEIRVTGPDGVAKEAPVTVAQLLSATAPLDALQSHCQKCRANVADRPFGCIGKINYPIDSLTEGWLTARLPHDPQNPDLAMLLKFLEEFGIDGNAVDQLRAKASMFESRSPKTGRWGTPPSKKQITSSQLLQMLIFGGNVVPQQAQLYTKLLSLSTVLTEKHPKSDQIEQFKTFFCAIVMAGRLDSPLLVDA